MSEKNKNDGRAELLDGILRINRKDAELACHLDRRIREAMRVPKSCLGDKTTIEIYKTINDSLSDTLIDLTRRINEDMLNGKG